MSKDENVENVPNLEIVKVVLMQIEVVSTMTNSNIQESCIHLLLMCHLVNY